MPVKHTPSPELANVKALVDGLQGAETRVGWFEGSKYADGTSVAYVASIQEFGYPEGGIPPRLGLRSTISEKQGEWAKNMATGARRVLKGQMTPFQALDAVGLVAAGDMRAAISEVTSPPLKPSTLAARRRRGNSNTKPLSDLRILQPTLNHVTKA